MPRSAGTTIRTIRLPLVAGLMLAACSHPYEQLSLPTPINRSVAPERGAVSSGPPGLPLAAAAADATTEARIYKGNGSLTSDRFDKAEAAARGRMAATRGASSIGAAQSTTSVDNDGITLNLVGASVQEVAKSILGDVLGVNYIVSEKVKATITLNTVKPVSKDGLLEIFDAVLRAEGAALVADGDVFKIVPSSDAVAGGSPLRSQNKGGRLAAGVVTDIVPLHYVSASEMERILRSAAPQAGILRVDSARNLLVVSGTRNELNSMLEMVRVFDVDWMRGMSFGIFPVEAADPDAIAQELDVLFANDRDSPTKGIVRFIPNKRLKSVLVISSRPEYLRKAQTWLSRIDMASQATEKRVHLYHVQHRPASELAQLLQKVYSSTASGARAGGAATSRTSGATSPVAAIEGTRTAQEATAAAGAAGVSPQPVTPPAQPTFGSAAPPDTAQRGADATTTSTTTTSSTTAAVTATSETSSSGPPPDDRTAGISVVPDEPNNSLVVTATPNEYKRVLQILQSIDVSPNQLLIEATIAEITLNDDLKFGVRWFIQNHAGQFSFSDIAAGGFTQPFAGFNALLNLTNLQGVLHALSSITDVNVVSSPTLTVIENKKATLQVGDEVPIVTQTAQGVQVAGAPVVNSVSFRSTGVILGITPRISDDGNVLLDIEQEVSDAVATTSSNINSPTIQQRRIKTTVSTRDGETIVLAGFMQDRATRARDQVPLLGDIPFFGNAFKNKSDNITRTELIIAITPQILKDSRQIDGVTAEYRDKLNFSTRPQRTAPPAHREQLERIIR